MAGAGLALGLALALLSLPGAARAADTEWRGFNGGYAADRYSPLDQINTHNVQSLRRVGGCQLPETTSFQAGPVMVRGILYVTTATTTYALNARNGQMLWKNQYHPKSMGLGTPVRGVAYSAGRLYRGTPDGHLLCMDAETGRIIWDVVGADASKGDYFTAVPVVWQGLIYLANAGSDIGTIGHLMAFRIEDGKRVWTFDIVPSRGPAAATWPSDPTKLRAGGGTYSSYALDTETGTLYVPTGNPGPDFVGDYRPGDNLYTCSVVMLDAKTGELKGYHQFVPHDVHDWDIAASPALYTSAAGRKLVAVGGKNGYLYGLDRDLQTVRFQVPLVRMMNTDAPITAAGTHFAPGTQGGVNWNGPAYSPAQNALYVNTRDWATTVKLGGPKELANHKVGDPFIGSANGFGVDDPASERAGQLTAVDADSGRVLWVYKAPLPLAAAVTPTAGGLVFTGDLEGNFLAFDAATGSILFKEKAGGPIGGGVITYALGGKQYVAVAAGMTNKLMGVGGEPASVAIYALDAADSPPAAPRAAAIAQDAVAKNLATFDTLDFVVFSNQEWVRLHESHSQDIIVNWPDGHHTNGLQRHIDDLKALFVYAPDTCIKEHPLRFGVRGDTWTSAMGPDHQINVNPVGGGDVFTCVTGVMTGTFTKPMPLGDGKFIQPTGKSFSIPMCTVGHWHDGVMIEESLYWDNATYMKQIGLGQ
ncbi:MAG TPA: PQQ-binding-like beta-propeller repeat protein [Armatimonadota bacterium]